MSDITSSPPSSTTPVFERPVMRGWLHAGGVAVVWGASPFLFARCATWAQVLWVLCYVVGVATMMGTSALFHRIRWNPRQRRAWRRADHSAIFFAISGSYLALAGLTMHGTIRMETLIVIGVCTLIGIAIRQLSMNAPKWANTIPFLVMSWFAALVMLQIYRGGGPLCFALIVGGGVAYSVGAIFYGTKRPKLSPRVFGYHELFHAFTLIGVGLHFAAISVALR